MEFLNVYKDGEIYREQVFDLYERAFPAEEKKPRAMMEALCEAGKMEILALAEEGEFVGLAVDIFSEEAAILDYFAIVPEKRGGGCGSRAVQALVKRRAGTKYIFEIERPDETAENAVERARRKAFYLRNGLKETGLYARVYGTNFEMLTPDGALTFQEYTDTLRKVIGEDGLRMLDPQQEN